MTSAEPSPGRPLLDRRARWLLPVFLVLLIVLSIHRYSQTPGADVYVMRGVAMGTSWSVKIAGAELSPDDEKRLDNLVSTRLARIDKLMSTWDPSSELGRFNAHPAREMFRVSRETREVLDLAQEVYELSGGAFDVTVGPLVRAWGFGAGAAEGAPSPPTPAELQEARARVGFQMLAFDALGRLYKQFPGVELDLSALAKGYAVDFVAEGLEKLGYTDFLFELGGELRGRGTHRDGSPWRVAVEEPRDEGRAIHAIVRLENASLATSGDYRSFYERDGQRFSHTIDPRNGRPLEHGLASVSVVHPEAARADALATALNVLGPEEGLALARDEGIAAYFITRVGEGFEVSMTDSFRALLDESVIRDGRRAARYSRAQHNEYLHRHTPGLRSRHVRHGAGRDAHRA
jgi:thiamine biosynthesis lipoprotein